VNMALYLRDVRSDKLTFPRRSLVLATSDNID
jgi:hypothetical protein